MKLKILTPEKMVLEKEVDSVTMPGEAGQFSVMSGHDLLVAKLVSGPLFVRWTDSEGKQQREDYEIAAGIAEVRRDTALVFTSTASCSLS